MIYYKYCYNCGKAVHSHEDDGGYESRSYNHKTLYPYQDRTLKSPESDFNVTVCQTCLDDDPSLNRLLTRKRIEWYNSYINSCDSAVERLNSKIKFAKVNIKLAKKDKAVYMELKQQLLSSGVIDYNMIPKNSSYGSW